MKTRKISVALGVHTMELRNLKVFEEMSDETTAFHADVYVDGAKVGYAHNSGGGEANNVVIPRELERKLETECNKHRFKHQFYGCEWDYTLEFLIGMMVEACWYDGKTEYVF